jgi:hypothetical protein
MAKQPAPAAAAPAASQSTDVAIFGKNAGLVTRMAVKFGIEPATFLTTLKQTAFRQRSKNGAPPVEVSNEQMAMLLHIAEKYDLDPFIRQLYAFPSEGGIVPIVPVDGWIAMINRHPQFESMEIFTPEPGATVDDYWTACAIQRKDRKKPTKIEEWLKECYRDTDPWNSMPKRMLRHKAIIQCARIAFGYSGIFDPDEGERIFANAIDVTPPRADAGKPITREPQRKSAQPSPSQSASSEMREEGRQGASMTQAPGPVRISLDQATVLADKLKEEGVQLAALLARYELGSLEDMPEACFREAVHVIDELSQAGAAK